MFAQLVDGIFWDIALWVFAIGVLWRILSIFRVRNKPYYSEPRGSGLAGAIDLVLVPNGTWSYPDPGRLVAQRFGADARTVVAEVGILHPYNCWQDAAGTIWVSGSNRVARFQNDTWLTYPRFVPGRLLSGNTSGKHFRDGIRGAYATEN